MHLFIVIVLVVIVLNFLLSFTPSSIILSQQNLNFLLADLPGSGGRLESVSASSKALLYS